jgi:antitoxin (DNA-binding transcriptional repressor) of toxin-antitoxin stability system
MTREISKSRFKAKALEIFRQVEQSGESVIVTDHGQPKLELRCLPRPTADALEQLRESVLRFDNPLDPIGHAG